MYQPTVAQLARVNKLLTEYVMSERTKIMRYVNTNLKNPEYQQDPVLAHEFVLDTIKTWSVNKDRGSSCVTNQVASPKYVDDDSYKNGGSSTSTLLADDYDAQKLDEDVKEIGPYTVIKTLGEGTFGKVRLCEHKLSKEKIAIKTIQKADVKTTKQRNSVQREVRLMKLLSHPNIIHVEDVNEDDEEISIIMEYASGGELFDYIVARGMLKEKESRLFFRQIISAVDYCHQNSVIHRDLKPENMLLDANKNIKIIDFGFGNTYHSDRQLDTYCGSPFYAAPEMIRGQPYCGPEVDIWSLGVILYALLAGRLPFEAPVISDLYQEIGRGKYHIPKHFTPDATQLIGRMLTVDSDTRATMKEILEHPWLNEGYMKPPINHSPPRPKYVLYPNQESVAELVEYGIAESEIHRILSENCGLHPISSLYHMVDEARLRRGATRPTKLHDPLGVSDSCLESRFTIYSPSPKSASPIGHVESSAAVLEQFEETEETSRSRRGGVYQPTPRKCAAPYRPQDQQNDKTYLYRPHQTQATNDFTQISIPNELNAPLNPDIPSSSSKNGKRDRPHQQLYSTIFNPLQQYFCGRSGQQVVVPPSVSASTSRKPKLSEFIVDHLFNVKAELQEYDVNRIKSELERVLLLFGIDFSFAPVTNAFICRERTGSQNTFTIDLQIVQGEALQRPKANLFFKCGYGNVFNLRKLYSKLLDEVAL